MKDCLNNVPKIDREIHSHSSLRPRLHDVGEMYFTANTKQKERKTLDQNAKSRNTIPTQKKGVSRQCADFGCFSW